MNKTKITSVLIVAAAVGFGAWSLSAGAPSRPSLALGKVVLHKSATCGCCGVWGAYIKHEGYDLEIHDISDSDLSAKKHELGVPHDLESCHTAEVDGYVIEGHIPTEAIAKLLAEKPDIKGIGMPGMPAGSPGMGGNKNGPFVVYAIEKDGSTGPVFVTL